MKGIFLFGVLLMPCIALAQTNSTADEEPKPAPTWTVSLTAAYTNTFQLILGDRFGKGPDFQNKLTASVKDAFRSGDTVSMFAWSTTDLPSATPNWQAGFLYRAPFLRKNRQTLFMTMGGQRWLLPLVGSGAKDWMVTGSLMYETSVKRVPIFFSEDSYSLLKSTLPTGSALYSQIYAQHRLLKHHGFQLALRHGPAYSYSWGFYGIEGNRVLRYGGSLIANWRGNTFETGYRKQVGLQDGIANNGYIGSVLSPDRL